MLSKMVAARGLTHASLLAQRAAFFSARVLVTGLPAEWDETEINSRFSLAGPLDRIHFIKSKTGLRTGKAVLTYQEEDGAEQAIA